MRRGRINRTNNLVARLIVIVCCTAVILTEHTMTEMFVSGCNYLLVGLFLLGILKSHFVIPDRDHIISLFVVSSIVSLIAVIAVNMGNSSWFSGTSAIKGQIIYSLFFVIPFFVSGFIDDLQFPYRVIRVISLTSGSIVIIQYVTHMVGMNLHGLPLLGEFVFHSTEGVFRPSAFFAEPSYFAEVVILDLFYNLFVRLNYKLIAFNIISIIPSGSGLGVLMIASMLLTWVLLKRISSNIFVNITIKSITFAGLSFVIFSCLGYNGDNVVINRLLVGGTIHQRTYRAFELFGLLAPVNKMFGIGMQNIARYLDWYRIVLDNDRLDTLANREFMQSFGYLLCALGILGSQSTFLCFAKIFKQLKNYKKLIIVFLLLLMLVSNIITRQIFVLWMIMITTMLSSDQERI